MVYFDQLLFGLGVNLFENEEKFLTLLCCLADVDDDADDILDLYL